MTMTPLIDQVSHPFCPTYTSRPCTSSTGSILYNIDVRTIVIPNTWALKSTFAFLWPFRNGVEFPRWIRPRNQTRIRSSHSPDPSSTFFFATNLNGVFLRATFYSSSRPTKRRCSSPIGTRSTITCSEAPENAPCTFFMVMYWEVTLHSKILRLVTVLIRGCGQIKEMEE